MKRKTIKRCLYKFYCRFYINVVYIKIYCHICIYIVYAYFSYTSVIFFSISFSIFQNYSSKTFPYSFFSFNTCLFSRDNKLLVVGKPMPFEFVPYTREENKIGSIGMVLELWTNIMHVDLGERGSMGCVIVVRPHVQVRSQLL